MKKILTLIIVFGWFLVKPTVAQAPAPENIGISISPPTFELAANPGKVLTNSIRVQNLTNKALHIVTSVKNFGAVGEEGAVGLSDEDSRKSYSMAEWITVEPQEIDISPKAIGTFNFLITVPREAEPGGHFGSIVFRIKNDSVAAGGSGAMLASEVGSLILLRVAGKTTEQAQLMSFEPSRKFFEYGPVSLDYRIKNLGNVHVKPGGKIVIKDIFNRKVGEFNVDPRNVLPGAVRKISGTWNNKWLWGKYRAQLVLSYGNNGQVLAAETQFWGLAYKQVGLGLLVGLMVFALFYRGRKRLALALRIILGGDPEKR